MSVERAGPDHGGWRQRPEARQPACECLFAAAIVWTASGSSMTPLSAQNLAKQFRQGDRRVVALEAVSLEVAQGQFLAIMGASGSGKSTLLHLMAGLTNPDEGRVVIDGTDLSRLGDR